MSRHFFIVGAQRSGTTWLHRMLDQHPDIAMARPVRPEPKFFIDDALYAKGLDFYRSHYFPRGQHRWLGEKSTSYIEHRSAAERIARDFPDALLLFVLRDPVERALSNYRFSVANGLEPLSLEQALDSEHERAPPAGLSVSPYAYAARGHYVRYLDMWREFFPRTQLLPLVTEQLVGSGAAVRALFGRMDLDRDVALADVDTAVNEAIATAPVDPDARQALRASYREDNHALARSYDVDISQWQ